MRLSFWTRTQKLIKEHKISQKKFSELVGINYNTYRCWVYNDRVPDAESAYYIAKALGVSVEYLVSGKDNLKQRIKKLVLKLGEEADRI